LWELRCAFHKDGWRDPSADEAHRYDGRDLDVLRQVICPMKVPDERELEARGVTQQRVIEREGGREEERGPRGRQQGTRSIGTAAFLPNVASKIAWRRSAVAHVLAFSPWICCGAHFHPLIFSTRGDNRGFLHATESDDNMRHRDLSSRR